MSSESFLVAYREFEDHLCSSDGLKGSIESVLTAALLITVLNYILAISVLFTLKKDEPIQLEEVVE